MNPVVNPAVSPATRRLTAADVMVTDVISVSPDDAVRDVAALLLDRRISGAPVIDAQGELVGMISEGDLVRRAEIGTEARRAWWLELLTAPDTKAREFIRSHAVRVADVMARPVISAPDTASLAELVALLETHGIKRLPILRAGKVVGIVTRRNLMLAFLEAAAGRAPTQLGDADIKAEILSRVRALPFGQPWLFTVTVSGGEVDLWGPVNSEIERRALRVAAEAVPGVRHVEDHLYRIPASIAA